MVLPVDPAVPARGLAPASAASGPASHWQWGGVTLGRQLAVASCAVTLRSTSQSLPASPDLESEMK